MSTQSSRAGSGPLRTPAPVTPCAPETLPAQGRVSAPSYLASAPGSGLGFVLVPVKLPESCGKQSQEG